MKVLEQMCKIKQKNWCILNTFATRWIPCGNIHHYRLVLAGHSNHQKVDTAMHSPPVG